MKSGINFSDPLAPLLPHLPSFSTELPRLSQASTQGSRNQPPKVLGVHTELITPSVLSVKGARTRICPGAQNGEKFPNAVLHVLSLLRAHSRLV